MAQKPKLVAFDLDGTLAESKTPMTPEMGTRIARLLEEMPVAVMSGAKTQQFLHQFVPALPPHFKKKRLYLFPTNAARCLSWRWGSWRPVYDHTLSPEEKQKILAELKTALEAAELAGPPQEVWGAQIEDRGGQISFSSLGQSAPVSEKEKWYRMFDGKRQNLRKILQGLLPDFSVRAGGLTTVDVTRKGINKAYGLRQLSKITNIPISDMVYVGDALFPGGNDAVVMETGVRTHAVTGPKETTALIDDLLPPPPQKEAVGMQKKRRISLKALLILILVILATLLASGSILKLSQNSAYSLLNLFPKQTSPADEFSDLIRVTTPRPGDVVSSPLSVSGEARGFWYFEADFPVILTDWDGKIIAQVPAHAEGDWMTTDFVPFTATLHFTVPESSPSIPDTGSLILQKDNPSGLPENDKAIEIPVRFR